MTWFVAILTALLQPLLPWLVKKTKPTAEDADVDRKTRDRLRDQVRKHWFVLIVVLLLSGCVRTVYVPHGTPVRLRETVKDVKVWVKDADGQVVAGRMDLPEGWYALAVETEEP